MIKPPGSRARYTQMRPRDFPLRVFGLIFVVMFGLGTVSVVASAIGGGDQGTPVGFAIAWVLILVWNSYWFVWRFSLDLRFDGDTLSWHTLLLHREVAVADITEVRPFPLPGIDAIHRESGPSILVMSGAGLRRFMDEITQARPDVVVQLHRKSERAPSAIRPDGFSQW